jgi:4,4'-diaponeurosporenoate glycosyltransferase
MNFVIMSPLMTQVFCFLFFFVFWLVGFFLLGRFFYYSVLITDGSVHTSSELKEDVSLLPLSIIIPARNEALNLPKLLNSISEQNIPNLEVIVIDDGSTDGTAEIAKSYSATVISGLPLPANWTGKNWACYQGAKASSHDHLLFLDADTEFEPGGIARLIRFYQNFKNDIAISVLPFQKFRFFYERFSLFFHLLMAMGTDAFLLHQNKKNHKLVGQSLLISKSLYFGIGGHESVKGKILENFNLTKVLNDNGIRTYTISGQSILSIQMFPEGFLHLIQGWLKAFTQGAAGVSKSTLFATFLWISACFLPFIFFTQSMLLGLFTYAFMVIQIYFLSRRLGQYRMIDAFLYPLYLVFYQFLHFYSVINERFGGSVIWKGREVSARE